MKKFLIGLLMFIILLLAAAVFLPYLFKDRIISAIKAEANKNITAQIDFDQNIAINIFRSFPDLYLGVNKISLVSSDSSFKSDTLVYCEKAELRLDLLELYKNQKYIVRSLNLNKAAINLEVNKDTIENWDIFVSEDSTESSEITLEFDKISLDECRFTYADYVYNIFSSAEDIYHTSTGVYSSDSMRLASESGLSKFNLTYDGISYMSGYEVVQNGDIAIDWIKEKFSFPHNDFKLNGLPVDFNGYFAFTGENSEDMEFDMVAKSKSSDIKHFLTLIPAVYQTDFESIQSKGKGELFFSFVGLYSATVFPSYKLALKLDEGYMKYPDMKDAASDIFLDLLVQSPDGVTDNLEVDVNKLHFKFGDEPFDMKLSLRQIFTDPYIDASGVGLINFDKIKSMIPLEEGTELSGKMLADLKLKGKTSSISNADVNAFSAAGDLSTSGLRFSTPDMPLPLSVTSGELQFNNQDISIPSFSASLGDNDLSFSADLKNCFAYLMNDETLRGTMNLKSTNFNANDFISESSTPGSDTLEMTVVEVPGNLNFNLQASIDKLRYDDLTINGFTGTAEVLNKKVILKGVSAELLGGSVALNGTYASDDIRPKAKFDLSYSNISAKDLVKHFEVAKAFAPFASKLETNTQAMLNFEADLKEDMSPDLSTLTMGGSLSIAELNLNGFKILNQIDKKLGMQKFDGQKLKDLLLRFQITEGKMFVKPFDLMFDSIRLNLDGFTKLDGSLDYNGILSLPASYVSEQTSVVQNITKGSAFSSYVPKAGDYLDLNLDVLGTYAKPELKLNIKEVVNNYKSSLGDVLKSQLDQQKKQAEAKAKAEMDKLKNEAQQQAEAKQREVEAELERKKKETEERLKREAEEKARQAKEEAERKLKEDAEKKLKGILKPK
ncbi:hypothetical protein GYB22_06070 [bacterium]|nr:hypothetical protein [bacterium]